VVVARRGIALVEGQEQRRPGLGRQGREASRQRSVGGFGPGPIGLGDVAAEIGQRRHLGQRHDAGSLRGGLAHRVLGAGDVGIEVQGAARQLGGGEAKAHATRSCSAKARSTSSRRRSVR